MTTTTAAEGLRNCFFLNTNKIQMASSTETLAKPKFKNYWKIGKITANFGLDNSSYRAQPHSIIVNKNIICIANIANISCIKHIKYRKVS
jgi:hypothetical protein